MKLWETGVLYAAMKLRVSRSELLRYSFKFVCRLLSLMCGYFIQFLNGVGNVLEKPGSEILTVDVRGWMSGPSVLQTFHEGNKVDPCETLCGQPSSVMVRCLSGIPGLKKSCESSSGESSETPSSDDDFPPDLKSSSEESDDESSEASSSDGDHKFFFFFSIIGPFWF